MDDGWFKLSITLSTGISIGDDLRLYWGSFGSNLAIGDNWYVWGAMLTAEDGAYIPTDATAATVTDYTLNGPYVTLGEVPAIGAVLDWDGSGDAYPLGTHAFIQDNQDMTMTIGISGEVPSAVFLALLSGGYIPIKPEGVRVNSYVVTSESGTPIFGFDMQNDLVGGFDSGSWGTVL
jgi:hypothetical protein